MSHLRYGKRNVAKMIRQFEALRQLIRAERTPDTQTAWDAVEEHIDFAYRALPAGQPATVPLCECGMTGPCKWTECKAPILSAHVNKTPKSEHEARDVLTPATKGGDA